MDLPLCCRAVCARVSRLAVLAAMCLVAGSGLVPAAEVARPAETAEPVLKIDPEFPDSMVVATVNSEPITVGDVLEPYRTRLEKLLEYNVPRERHGEARTMWVKRFLPDVLAHKLQVQGFMQGLTEEDRKSLDEHLNEQWDEYACELREKIGVSTMQELSDRLKDEGTDLARVKHNWRESVLARQHSLSVLRNSRYEPTNRELHDYYEENGKRWECPSRVKWQQIVVRRKPGEERASAMGRAHELFGKLQRGADFAELARTHSDGPTKAQGGNWDWMESDALVCREIGELLATGDVGRISDVISYKGEFHIVRILDREDARRKSFEEVEVEVCDTLREAGYDRCLREAAQELVDKAVIKTVFGDDWKFQHPLLEKHAAKPAEPKVDREPSLFDGSGPKTVVVQTGRSEVVLRVEVTEGGDSPRRRYIRDPVDESAGSLTESPFGEALNRPWPEYKFPEGFEDAEEQP